MSITLTTGRILVGQTVNLGDYNSKKAEVDLTFTPPDGDDGLAPLDETIQLASSKLGEILGLAPAPAKAPSTRKPRQTKAAEVTLAPTPANAVSVSDDEDEVPLAARDGGSVEKAQTASKAAVIDDDEEVSTASAAPAKTKSAAVIDDEEEAAPERKASGKTAGKAAVIEDDEPTKKSEPVEAKSAGKAAAVEDDENRLITDAELSSAVTKANDRIRNPRKIKEAIAKYTPEGAHPTVHGLPQDVRESFIFELEMMS